MAVVAGWNEQHRTPLVVWAPVQAVGRVGGMNLVALPHVQHLVAPVRIGFPLVEEDPADHPTVGYHDVVALAAARFHLSQQGLLPMDSVPAGGVAETGEFVPSLSGVQAVPDLEQVLFLVIQDAGEPDEHAGVPGGAPAGNAGKQGVAGDLDRLMQHPGKPGHGAGEGVVEEELPLVSQGRHFFGGGAGRGGTGWGQAAGQKKQGRGKGPRLLELHGITRFPARGLSVAAP